MKKIYLILLPLFIGCISNVNSQTAIWSPLTSGTTNNLTGISAPSSTVCYVCGVSGTIRKTSDGGATWTAQVSGTTQVLYAIHFTDINTGYAIGDAATALKTTNGGSTWTPMSVPVGATYNFRNVYFFDANTGFIVGGHGTSGTAGTILKTIDAGATWTSLNTTGASTHSIYSIFFTSSLVGYADDFNGNAIKTTDGGTSWTAYPIGPTSGINGSIYFPSSTTGFVIGTNGVIRTTTDAGFTWSGVLSGSTTDDYIGMDFYDVNHGFIMGGDVSLNVGRILSTTNGGLSWTSSTPGTPFLYRVDMVDANTGYVAGNNGTILKYTSNVGVSEINNGYSTFNSYPNPFTSSTTIDCGNYVFENNSQIEVYDLEGRLVMNEKFSTKESKIVIDRNGFVSGIYFYKVYDGERMIGAGKLIAE